MLSNQVNKQKEEKIKHAADTENIEGYVVK